MSVLNLDYFGYALWLRFVDDFILISGSLKGLQRMQIEIPTTYQLISHSTIFVLFFIFYFFIFDFFSELKLLAHA